MKYPFPMNDHFISQIWPFVAQNDELSFYELEEPRPLIKTFDRSEIIDHEYAQLVSTYLRFLDSKYSRLWLFLFLQEECPYTSYKYSPINEGGIRGSCQDYTTRTDVPREKLVGLTLDDVLLK